VLRRGDCTKCAGRKQPRTTERSGVGPRRAQGRPNRHSLGQCARRERSNENRANRHGGLSDPVAAGLITRLARPGRQHYWIHRVQRRARSEANGAATSSVASSQNGTVLFNALNPIHLIAFAPAGITSFAAAGALLGYGTYIPLCNEDAAWRCMRKPHTIALGRRRTCMQATRRVSGACPRVAADGYQT